MSLANDRIARIGIQVRRVHFSLSHSEAPTAQSVADFTAIESLNTQKSVR